MMTRLMPLALAAAFVRPTQDPPPTFTRDIAPILFTHCAGCHRPSGSAPFSLRTYDDVKRHATQIADVTRRRVMPPWKADPHGPAFVGQTPLTDAQIHLIQTWSDAGAPEGNPRDLPPAPESRDGWLLGAPDLVVSAPAYTLQAGGADVFRIFVIRVPLQQSRWVSGFEFRAGSAKAVHHANLRIDSTSKSRDLDA